MLIFVLISFPSPVCPLCNSCVRKEEGISRFISTSSPADCRVSLQVWSWFYCWRWVTDECKLFIVIIPLFPLIFSTLNIKGQNLWSFPNLVTKSLSMWWDNSKGKLFFIPAFDQELRSNFFSHIYLQMGF